MRARLERIARPQFLDHYTKSGNRPEKQREARIACRTNKEPADGPALNEVATKP